MNNQNVTVRYGAKQARTKKLPATFKNFQRQLLSQEAAANIGDDLALGSSV